MNTILNMMSALYNFVIEPFLLPNKFNTKILNQLIFTVHSQLEKFINNHIYIFGVIPAANTVRVLIPYRNITNICHKLIIYRH